MSIEKKLVRARFRDLVFERAKYSCQGYNCKFISSKEDVIKKLDAHHITNREAMPNGGYVPENGIALCAGCHEKAEVFYKTGKALPKFSPEELYKIINSSFEEAKKASYKI